MMARTFPPDRRGSAHPVVRKLGALFALRDQSAQTWNGSGGEGNRPSGTPFLENLNSPFGVALVGKDLYVANTDALIRFPYVEGHTDSQPGETVVDLPGGPVNHHWTKNVIASRDGSRLYVTVGSNSNVGERGMMNEVDRAAILEVDPARRTRKVFASGLRNPNGLGWEPQTGVLGRVVNERDELGSDLVPDYLTSVREGGFYGWPYSYFAKHVDPPVEPRPPDLVARAIVPDYAPGAHVAALGLVFYEHRLLGERYAGGAFIGEHGSWNRRPPSGYKVVFVRFKDGRPVGLPEDILHRLSRHRRERTRPAGRRRGRSRGRAARRGRRRQHRLARHAGVGEPAAR